MPDVVVQAKIFSIGLETIFPIVLKRAPGESLRLMQVKGESSGNQYQHEAIAGVGSSFRASDPKMESQDEALYFRRAERDLYY